MTTVLLTHKDCLEHVTPEGHPERVDRLKSVLTALREPEFHALNWRDAPDASMEQIARVHPETAIRRLFDCVPETGFFRVDADTALSPGSKKAALRAAGAVVEGVDLLMRGEVGNAFCAVRPPGHHAEPNQAMGFCLINNVAVGAMHARASYGLNKIAVIDFDVHHGNGTQASFYDDPHLFYASTHQMPLYPGTDNPHEKGVADNIVNVALKPGSGSEAFRAAMNEIVLPKLRAFEPEFIFISAGFDAHEADPLSNLNLTDDDYAWATECLMGIAAEVCEGRLVSTLEGGYDLDALASASKAHVSAMMSV